MSRNRKRKRLKSKDKVVQKNSKDGLVEHNLSENTTKSISQKIEDVNLEKNLKDKKVNLLITPNLEGIMNLLENHQEYQL